MSKEGIPATIPLEKIRPPKILLRPVVIDSDDFRELRDSLKTEALLNAICVRPHPTLPDLYEVVDGYWRYTAFKLLKKTCINATIVEMSDREVIAAQLKANAIRPETTPVQFARHLKRLLKQQEGMTLSELSGISGKRIGWIKNQLLLLDLTPEAQKLVDEDAMSVSNAYLLAKVMPFAFQRQFITQACELPKHEFGPLITAVIKRSKEAARQGRLDETFLQPFQPVAHFRAPKDVLKEIQSHLAAAKFLTLGGAKTPEDGWVLALKWVLSLDPESIEHQRQRSVIRKQKNALERLKDVDAIDREVPD